MKRYLNILLIVTVISSCKENTESVNEVKFRNNIDEMLAWNEFHYGKIIKDDAAHSGIYVNSINSESPYSTTFYMRLGDISKKPLRKIKISGWIKSKNLNSSPTFVIDILDKDRKSIEYLAKDGRKEMQKSDTWFQVTNEIKLDNAKRGNPDNYIKVYFTNGSPESCLVDDLEIIFEN